MISSSVVGLTSSIAYLFINLFSFSAQMIPISQENIRAAQELGEIELFWTPRGFIMGQGGDKHFIEKAFIDPEIRDFDNRQMMYWLGLAKDIQFDGKTVTMFKRTHEEFEELVDEASQEAELAGISSRDAELVKAQLKGLGGYLEVVQYNDGSFGIHAHQRLPGGGIFGGKLGAWVGYVGTHIVAQGAILAVSGVVTVVCPVAGPAVYYGLQAAAAPIVQPVAVAMAVAGGITGAVVTGPV